MIQKVHDGQGSWKEKSNPGNTVGLDGRGAGRGEINNCGMSIGFGGIRHQNPRQTGMEALMGMANIYGTGHGGG
jgi:hypothetical protein